jgi:signal transduction histidine kinase
MRTITKKLRQDEMIGLESLGVRWTSVLDALSEGISVHSISGEILWANKQLCDTYHKSLSELKGLNYEQAFHNEMISGNTQEHVLGKVLSVHIEPLFDEQNQPCGFARIVRDVTEKHSAQEQLLKAERLATLGRILFGVAHDVGTPLNVISGYAEFLLARTKPGEQGHKELSSIINQSKRIATLLGDTLDMARAPQRRNDVLELEPLLAGLLELVASELRKSGVKATLTCTISPALIYGEASQLRQALFNILLNAVQELGTGGNLDLIIEQSPDAQEFLTLTIRGTGMSDVACDLSSSVARFLAEDDPPATPGLGLLLARQILQGAGASVGSAKGGGIVIRLLAASAGETNRSATLTSE